MNDSVQLLLSWRVIALRITPIFLMVYTEFLSQNAWVSFRDQTIVYHWYGSEPSPPKGKILTQFLTNLIFLLRDWHVSEAGKDKRLSG